MVKLLHLVFPNLQNISDPSVMMCITDMPQCSSFTLDVGSEVNEVSVSTAWLFCNFLLNKKKSAPEHLCSWGPANKSCAGSCSEFAGTSAHFLMHCKSSDWHWNSCRSGQLIVPLPVCMHVHSGAYERYKQGPTLRFKFFFFVANSWHFLNGSHGSRDVFESSILQQLYSKSQISESWTLFVSFIMTLLLRSEYTELFLESNSI